MLKDEERELESKLKSMQKERVQVQESKSIRENGDDSVWFHTLLYYFTVFLSHFLLSFFRSSFLCCVGTCGMRTCFFVSLLCCYYGRDHMRTQTRIRATQA